MKRFLGVFIVAFIILFGSCKQDELIVNFENQGNLKIKLLDNNNNALSGVEIKLYLSGVNEPKVYSAKTTNASGVANFGELISDWYTVYADNIEIDGEKYALQRDVQVMIGESDAIEMNPADYTGELLFNVSWLLYSATKTIADVNVCLINAKDYNNLLTHSEIISLAYKTGQTDSNGQISFTDVSSDISYISYIYFDENHSGKGFYLNIPSYYTDYYSGYEYYSVETGEAAEKTVYVNKTDLFDLKGSVDLNIYYYGDNGSGNYGENPISNINTVLVKTQDFNSYNLEHAGHNLIMSHAVYTGITNSDGDVSFTNIEAYERYYVYVYFDENRRAWGRYQTVACNEDETSSYSIDVDEDDLNLP
jgi:hypothetical protein